MGNVIDYFKRAMGWYNQEQFAKAIYNFTCYLELNPKEGIAYFYRANAKFFLGDKLGAFRDWERAGELGYQEAYKKLNENSGNLGGSSYE
jgi:tetratricopeptide (TPR) repeat protein